MENGRSRLEQAQKDVDEVTVIMLDNLNKANEREAKLGELENRADQLREKSKVFAKTAGQVKQKKRFENMKWKVVLIVGGVVALSVIIVVLVLTLQYSSSGLKDSDG